MKGNFCEACSAQTNPRAFREYSIALKTGEVIKVKAVNQQHARSQVVYGGDMRVDDNGKPFGTVKIHPENIAFVQII